jgi:hypothetical protein
VLPLCREAFQVKQRNPGIVFTHCFLHREALISKSVVPEVQQVLDETTKMVNYVKSRPYNRGCSLHCVFPWKLLTHNSYCTRN